MAGKTIFLTLPPWLAQKHGLQAYAPLGVLPKDPSRPDIRGRRIEREPLVRYLPDPPPVGKLPERRVLPKPPKRGKLPEL